MNADSGIFLREPQLQCRDYLVAGPYKELKNYKPQDWNEIEVVVKGDTATCTCNGEPLKFDAKLPPTGPIGLEADRGQMEYRRIRIKEDRLTTGRRTGQDAANPNMESLSENRRGPSQFCTALEERDQRSSPRSKMGLSPSPRRYSDRLQVGCGQSVDPFGAPLGFDRPRRRFGPGNSPLGLPSGGETARWPARNCIWKIRPIPLLS